MQDVYTYTVDDTPIALFILIPIAFWVFSAIKKGYVFRTRDNIVLALVILTCFLGEADRFRKNNAIEQALISECRSSSCSELSGPVVEFRSFPGVKKRQTNSFRISYQHFKFTEKGQSYGYGTIVEQGGIFQAGKRFKIYVVNDKIIKAFEMGER